MHWTFEQLEAANGKYLCFSKSESTCLLQKSGTGWKIGVSKKAISTEVALQFLNHQQATLTSKDERLPVKVLTIASC